MSLVKTLCAKHNKPVVIICGKKDASVTNEQNVYDLLSMFDAHTSMTQTYAYIQQLVQKNKHQIEANLAKVEQ